MVFCMNVAISMISNLCFYIVGASGRKADRILAPVMGLNYWSPSICRQYSRRIDVSNYSVVNLMPVRRAKWQSPVFVFAMLWFLNHCIYVASNCSLKCRKPRVSVIRQRSSDGFCSWAECFSLKHNWRWNTCIQWPSMIECWEKKNCVCLVQS